MIDKNDDIQQRNIDLLIAGYWYEDLPPVIDIANMKGMINMTQICIFLLFYQILLCIKMLPKW